MDMQKSKINFQYNLFKKTLFMHFLVLEIFGKYYMRYILCGHGKIITIFQQQGKVPCLGPSRFFLMRRK